MPRLCSVELANFKNVGQGRIAFPSASGKTTGADIIGIYGQNGSGKTAVIEALAVFKSLLSGDSLSCHASDLILAGCDEARLAFELSIEALEGNATRLVGYHVTLKRADEGLQISQEKVFFTDLAANKPRKMLVIDHVNPGGEDARNGFTSAPKSIWHPLQNASAEFATEYAVAERVAFRNQTSFVLSMDLFRAMSRERDLADDEGSLPKAALVAMERISMPFAESILGLKRFSFSFFVLTTINNARISLNNMIISSCRDPWDSDDANPILLDISAPTVLENEDLSRLNSTIKAINVVLESLVPGLTLGVLVLGREMHEDGHVGSRIEVVSQREGRTLPFRCESEGVKKIVSLLGHLINVYNNENCCVAIDELDSGLFEFLLGELLEALSEHGKGQLVFTAHNLRPLETLPQKSLLFTTTNPEHRYIGFVGLKKTNNLRDQYLRAINLGGQPETIYEPTSKYEIDSAFFEAGCMGDEACEPGGEPHGAS